MANYGDAALDEAVRSGRLDLVAGTLDEKELQVDRQGDQGYSFLAIGLCKLPLTPCICPLQLQQAGFPPHWPFAVHLLAHLHNHSLCAPHLGRC